METPSTKPYLLRALYEWCADSGFTPYLVVAENAETLVPRESVRDGQITLNISANATQGLQMDNEVIRFSARFSGVARNISIPVARVLALYAKENGAGMAFELDDSEGAGLADDNPSDRAELTAVDGFASKSENEAPAQVPEGDDASPVPKKPVRKKPHLQRVK